MISYNVRSLNFSIKSPKLRNINILLIYQNIKIATKALFFFIIQVREQAKEAADKVLREVKREKKEAEGQLAEAVAKGVRLAVEEARSSSFTSNQASVQLPGETLEMKKVRYKLEKCFV